MHNFLLYFVSDPKDADVQQFDEWYALVSELVGGCRDLFGMRFVLDKDPVEKYVPPSLEKLGFVGLQIISPLLMAAAIEDYGQEAGPIFTGGALGVIGSMFLGQFVGNFLHGYSAQTKETQIKKLRLWLKGAALTGLIGAGAGLGYKYSQSD